MSPFEERMFFPTGSSAGHAQETHHVRNEIDNSSEKKVKLTLNLKPKRRIQALEGKIDQIMGQINLATPRPDPSPYQTPTSAPSNTSNDGYSTESIDVIGKGLLSYERANGLLEQYREAMLLFPFVMLPQTTTVEDLQAEKPFLLLCILVFSSFQDKALQKALEEIVKAYIGDVVIHSDHGSHPPPLETLQGLLVILAG